MNENLVISPRHAAIEALKITKKAPPLENWPHLDEMRKKHWREMIKGRSMYVHLGHNHSGHKWPPSSDVPIDFRKESVDALERALQTANIPHFRILADTRVGVRLSFGGRLCVFCGSYFPLWEDQLVCKKCLTEEEPPRFYIEGKAKGVMLYPWDLGRPEMHSLILMEEIPE